MIMMKNQDLNPPDEKFQLKDPIKRPNRFVVKLGSSLFNKEENKHVVASWRYDHDKNVWLILIKQERQRMGVP
ncbi:hypothetical protein Hanom_Chr04g00334061 [Helianthus anomalus]